MMLVKSLECMGNEMARDGYFTIYILTGPSPSLSSERTADLPVYGDTKKETKRSCGKRRNNNQVSPFMMHMLLLTYHLRARPGNFSLLSREWGNLDKIIAIQNKNEIINLIFNF